MKTVIINENDSGQRIDKFLLKAFPNLPKSLLYKSIRLKKIKLNKKRCEISTILKKDDIIDLYINDDLLSQNVDNKYNFINSSTILDIIYEDENILIVNKKSGLNSHSSYNNSSDTLINRIKYYLHQKGEYIPKKEMSFAPAICNRLDRNTFGLVIAAKNAFALREMNRIIKNHELKKKYLCITINPPPKSEDIITAYHIKNNKINKVFISNNPKKNYKKIITKYKLIKFINNFALLEVELITGRTHQIRAHLAHIDCPILGDNKYGNAKINKKYNIKYQSLCSYSLEFNIIENSPLSYLNSKIIKLNPDKIFNNLKF